jgi:hypothetical protein
MAESKVLEKIKVYAGDLSTNLGAESSPTADSIETKAFLKLDKFKRYCAIGAIQGCASDAVITLTLLKATAAAGTNSATMVTTVTDTATSTNVTDLLQVAAELDAATLAGDNASTGSSHYWMGARLTTSGASGTEVAAIVHFVTDATYEPQTN